MTTIQVLNAKMMASNDHTADECQEVEHPAEAKISGRNIRLVHIKARELRC